MNMENFKIKDPNDGLDFICEICGDRVGGCRACGWGKRLQRSQKNVKPKTQEEHDDKNNNDETALDYFRRIFNRKPKE